MARPSLHDRQCTLNKALTLFWSKGYQATSMKDLEQALDMRPGSIYSAFGSKFGLFKEAVLLYTDSRIAHLKDTIDAAGDTLDGLTEVLKRFAFIASNEAPSCACFLVRSLIELENGDDEARLFINEQLSRMEDIFRMAFKNSTFRKSAPPGYSSYTDEELARLFQMKLTGLRIASMYTHDQNMMQILLMDCTGFLQSLRAI